MNFKKVVPVFAMALGLSLTALAGTHETKTEAPSKSETKARLDHTYYVTGVSGSNYMLQENPPAGGCTNTGALPCQITSEEPLGSQVSKDLVDNEDGIQIESTRQSF